MQGARLGMRYFAREYLELQPGGYKVRGSSAPLNPIYNGSWPIAAVLAVVGHASK